MKVLRTAAAACFVPLLMLAAPAEARPARCVVTVAGGEAYRGACDFRAERGGSFTIAPSGRRLLTGDVTSLSLTVAEPGLAEVRRLTSEGINSRWGEARRSRRDRACWDGRDYRVCVYSKGEE